ncbi:hypothetical protein [Alicyclobacillus mengziensis]|uniref:Uncharacterized protein n=1 Tax=Alicyclobacillus mengziensis TaxID=2931921 RepID=A0A9X7W2B2_9BACL|nr:hypothetical protein [Alicyclobacillus mengziensis]QSO49177.1 hypothetical protein JZ786_09790 [Alicyclobacillus mengziensis]
MNAKTRNSFLGVAMFLEHTGLVCPGVIEKANYVARQGGYEIPNDIEESLSPEDRKEIVKACAMTVLLGQDRAATELERLVMLHIVDATVQRDFLSAHSAFDVMYDVFGMEPTNSDGWTNENWQSSYNSIVGFDWSKIEQQLAELREKAGRNVLRANEEIQHQLSDARAFWERVLRSNLEYVDNARKPSFNDSLAIYNAAADVAWQYKIEIATTRPLF